MIYIEPKIPFEQTTGRMIVELAHVFEMTDIARMFDVSLSAVKKKYAAAIDSIESEQKINAKNYSVYDLDVAVKKIINMLSKYLAPDYSPENEDTMLKIIDNGDKLLKAFDRMKKPIDEFIESREMMKIIIDAIKISSDANKIIKILLDDKRLKTLL